MDTASPIRRFSGSELIIASHNKGKVAEIADLLGPYVTGFPSASELNLAEPEETGATFIANAELKALAAATVAGKPALADDSGLAVYALDGAPGIHSARYAERPDGTRDFTFAMEKLNRALAEMTDRRAAFKCALSVAWPDGHCETVEGRVEGVLDWPPRGDKGFGYDPIFVPNGYSETFGQMEPGQKHAMSHRADAFAKLVARCFA